MAVDLTLGADGYKGQTPLTLALGQWWKECPAAETDARVDVVKALVQADADVNIIGKCSLPKESSSATPLMQACIQGSIECVQLLLDANANIQAQNTMGYTALHFAAEHGTSPHHIKCVDLIIKRHRAASKIRNKKNRLAHELAADTMHGKGILSILKKAYEEEMKKEQEELER